MCALLLVTDATPSLTEGQGGEVAAGVASDLKFAPDYEAETELGVAVTPPPEKVIRWQAGDFPLKYCVLKKGWSSNDRYELVKGLVDKAARDWVRICNVHFEHAAALDTADPDADGRPPMGVLFAVQAIDEGDYPASSFFPDEPANKRYLRVSREFFTVAEKGFSQQGILRHELGHILGFKHEHVAPDAPQDCPPDAPPTPRYKALTKYDCRSVMHYPCGDGGTKDLLFTELDKVGAQALYGKPK